MMQAALSFAPPAARGHWLGEPVTHFTATLDDVVSHIPSFVRVPFGTNPRLDMIVRRASKAGEIPIPTAVVSKKYVLVQHGDVLGTLVKALNSLDVETGKLRCHLTLSESGARMAIRVQLPDSLAFKARDEHPMALTYECFNSVDCSVPLFAVLGWFRFVCANGLVVGTTQARIRHHHRPPLRVEDFEPVLTEGLEQAAADRKGLDSLTTKTVSQQALRAWVDGPLATSWGPFAATRVYAIATAGVDGEPSRTPRNVPPHARSLVNRTPVPGANAPCKDRYGVAQALAWIAARRAEVAEQLAWRAAIPELLKQLR